MRLKKSNVSKVGDLFLSVNMFIQPVLQLLQILLSHIGVLSIENASMLRVAFSAFSITLCFPFFLTRKLLLLIQVYSVVLLILIISFIINPENIDAVHNDFFDIFYSYGIIAVVLYIVFLSVLLKRTMQYLKEKKENKFNSYIACFACVIIFGLVASNFYFQYYAVVLFIFLGMHEGLLLKSQNDITINKTL